MSGPAFDYTLDFKAIDFRQRPDLYRVGKGEQGRSEFHSQVVQLP